MHGNNCYDIVHGTYVPMQLLVTVKLTKLWTPKICLECLLRCRYKQSWARSPTTETTVTRVSIGHGTNFFYLKRSQKKSSISVIQEIT